MMSLDLMQNHFKIGYLGTVSDVLTYLESPLPNCLKTALGFVALFPLATLARAGLGPSPGWGPVRVGAHMGPYGPLCFFEKGYVSGSDGSV